MQIFLEYLKNHFLFYPLILFGLISLRYFFISTSCYVLLWKIFPKHLEHRKIQDSKPRKGQITIEIKHCLISFAAMSLVLTPLHYLFLQGKTSIYLDWNEHSIWTIPLYSLLILFWADTYFFFLHKWLHRPKILKHIHYVHHLSKVPTPFASHSFHWIEAILQILYLYPVVLWIPMHPWTFVTLMFISHFFATWGHLNYELMPLNTWNAWWGSWVTTSTHHNHHHQYNSGNHALYLKIWDKMFHTLDPHTEHKFHQYLHPSEKSSTSFSKKTL